MTRVRLQPLQATLPAPPPSYDRENEAQFRSSVEAAIREASRDRSEAAVAASTDALVLFLGLAVDYAGRAVVRAGANTPGVGIILSLGTSTPADISYTHTTTTSGEEGPLSTGIEVLDAAGWGAEEWGIITDGDQAEPFYATAVVGSSLTVAAGSLVGTYAAESTVHRVGARAAGIVCIAAGAGQVTASADAVAGTPEVVVDFRGTLYAKARAFNSAGEMGTQYPDSGAAMEGRGVRPMADYIGGPVSGSFAPDAVNGPVQTFTLTGNGTLLTPTNTLAGDSLLIVVTTAGYTLTLSGYKVPNGAYGTLAGEVWITIQKVGSVFGAVPANNMSTP